MLDKINSERARAHHHDRGPDRVPARAQEVRGQPARAARRHPLLRQRAARRPARGPRRRPDRRDARPGDDRVGAAHRRDGPPDLRAPCTPTRRPRPSTASSTCSRPTSSRRSAPSSRWCSKGIMCQALLPKASGSGRALAMEILVPNAAIRNLIREDKIHQIYSSMQTGQEKYGMQTFNQSPGQPLLRQADHAADGARHELAARRAAGHDQPRRRPDDAAGGQARPAQPRAGGSLGRSRGEEDRNASFRLEGQDARGQGRSVAASGSRTTRKP